MDPLSLFLSALPFIGLAVLTLIVFAITKEILSWRRVVPVNMVHIIQTEAQKELAVAVGSNEPYQKYLITVRRIEADEKIGMEQAKAMDGSDIKIIANSDNISGGLDAARALLSSGLGQRLGAVVEGFKNTEIGAKLLDGQTEPAKPNGATN